MRSAHGETSFTTPSRLKNGVLSFEKLVMFVTTGDGNVQITVQTTGSDAVTTLPLAALEQAVRVMRGGNS